MYHRDGFRIRKKAPAVMKDHNPDAVYVKVSAEFMTDGTILPKVIEWEDGRQYEVMRLLAPDDEIPFPGMKFVCLVNGQKVHLIYDQENRFFMFRRKGRYP